jgi:hypothetical protein
VTGLFQEYFGVEIKKKRLDCVRHLAEFLHFGVADGVMDTSEFYKKKLGSALPGLLYKQLKAFNLLYNTPIPEGKTIHHVMFNAMRQSQILLDSNFIQDTFKLPFITNEFPRSRNEMALTGDDLIEMGWKQGQELGQMIERMLDGIFTRQLKNDRECLLEFVNKSTQQ